MGGGLLVLYLLDRDAPEAEAQQPGGRRGGGFGGGPAPQDIGAWLHIGEDGRISVYTGKAEVGQNIRTSLTQAVAEELHVPIDSIRMVMADTQLTPFDMGTFGSRTTPDMSRRLRRAAAAAREALIDLAAETWKVDRKELTAADGAVVRAGTEGDDPLRQADPGPQAHEDRVGRAPTTPADKWTVAGHSVAKVDGRSFVTGGHRVRLGHPAARHVARQGAAAPTYHATLASVDLVRREGDARCGRASATATSWASWRRASIRPPAPWPRSRPSGSPARRSPTRTCSAS